MNQVDDDDLISDINVTPFVDVLLVLLVIFMITAPIVTYNIPVDLPNATTKDNAPSGADSVIVVTLYPDGKLFLNDSPVQADTFIDQIKPMISKSGDLVPIYIQADESIEYGKVATLMSKLSSNGIVNISLVLEKN